MGAVLVEEAGGKAWVNRAVHRLMRADATECWRRRGACRASACARSLTKLAASSLHPFFFFPPLLFPRRRSLLDDCFTGQSPGSAISIPAAPDVHEGLGQIQASAP